jgi:hypothetical protein
MKANRRAEETAKRPSFSSKELLKDSNAKKAFEKLTRKGLLWEEALTLLQSIPHASNKTVPLVKGMEPRVLLGLPDRINRLAQEIDKVNESPALTPQYIAERPDLFKSFIEPLDTSSPGVEPQVIARLLSMVPILLYHYARHLNDLLRRHYHSGSGKRIFPVPEQAFRKIYLLKLVKAATGKYHYEEVATLLEAAYRASGHAKTITAENLKKLVKNHPPLRLLATLQRTIADTPVQTQETNQQLSPR